MGRPFKKLNASLLYLFQHQFRYVFGIIVLLELPTVFKFQPSICSFKIKFKNLLCNVPGSKTGPEHDATTTMLDTQYSVPHVYTSSHCGPKVQSLSCLTINFSPEGIWLICLSSCKLQRSLKVLILKQGFLSWSTPSQSTAM